MRRKTFTFIWGKTCRYAVYKHTHHGIVYEQGIFKSESDSSVYMLNVFTVDKFISGLHHQFSTIFQSSLNLI